VSATRFLRRQKFHFLAVDVLGACDQTRTPMMLPVILSAVVAASQPTTGTSATATGATSVGQAATPDASAATQASLNGNGPSAGQPTFNVASLRAVAKAVRAMHQRGLAQVQELVAPMVDVWASGWESLVVAAFDLRNDVRLAAVAMSTQPDLAWLTVDLSVLSNNPVPGRQSSGFGWRSDPMHHRAKFHKGTDVRAPHGTPVEAAGDGVVLTAGLQNGYGNVVYVDHGGGIITRYGHLQTIVIGKGDVVRGGQLIGKVGSTGRATGPHLHFEVRIDERAVNPLDALQVAAVHRDTVDQATKISAMMQLAPAAQDAMNSPQDPPGKRHKHKKSRSERRGRGKRAKNLT
jgi:murein DD-endopeptidase MepM/ murein hydrolase activator NlpD